VHPDPPGARALELAASAGKGEGGGVFVTIFLAFIGGQVPVFFGCLGDLGPDDWPILV